MNYWDDIGPIRIYIVDEQCRPAQAFGFAGPFTQWMIQTVRGRAADGAHAYVLMRLPTPEDCANGAYTPCQFENALNTLASIWKGEL